MYDIGYTSYQSDTALDPDNYLPPVFDICQRCFTELYYETEGSLCEYCAEEIEYEKMLQEEQWLHPVMQSICDNFLGRAL